MTLLFIHGAGGFEEDGALASELALALGTELLMPHLPAEDMSVAAWADPIRQALTGLQPEDEVVAHSFGGSILWQVLTEGPPLPSRATFLAMPDWGTQGWDVGDYVVQAGEPPVSLQLHHCRDDEVVPFEHLALNAVALPSATTHEYSSGGHQFDGQIKALAEEIARR